MISRTSARPPVPAVRALRALPCGTDGTSTPVTNQLARALR
ncbi:hypothetical protein DB32_006837 [Sandaracinus amylolyticus]|uniref:Uncharacterized protein n=1 Tax=Sandaracinus amylolyticus TaxID=927083 RepID=A0A0F6YKX7_9BACT|nr:hypothetical protein DB32_006837 [Sandaracinus amylolyticus]